jgi:Mrr N-terminal domain
MAIPDFQTFMRPVLATHADGKRHSVAEIREAVASMLAITDEDRRVMLKSGRQPRYVNRIAWGRHPSRAGWATCAARERRHGDHESRAGGPAAVSRPSGHSDSQELPGVCGLPRPYSGAPIRRGASRRGVRYERRNPGPPRSYRGTDRRGPLRGRCRTARPRCQPAAGVPRTPRAAPAHCNGLRRAGANDRAHGRAR